MIPFNYNLNHRSWNPFQSRLFPCLHLGGRDCGLTIKLFFMWNRHIGHLDIEAVHVYKGDHRITHFVVLNITVSYLTYYNCIALYLISMYCNALFINILYCTNITFIVLYLISLHRTLRHHNVIYISSLFYIIIYHSTRIYFTVDYITEIFD